MNIKQITSTLSLLAFVLSLSCGSKKPNQSKDTVLAGQTMAKFEDLPEGLAMELSDGTEGGGSKPVRKNANATKISEQEATTILQRVSPIKKSDEDEQTFALRENSKPPPRTGKTIGQEFPPRIDKSAPSQPKAPALQVVRFAPEGEVPVAPHVSITFNQPMVAVTSQDDAAAIVPAKLSPKVAGKWRWLGTKTLLFDPEVRMPMSTDYSIEIPSGTKSETGAVLAESKSFKFSTPTLTIVDHLPNSGPQALEPLIAIRFDQKISQKDLVSHIHLTHGTKTASVRLATQDEIEADKNVSAFMKRAKDASQEDWTIVVRPKAALPKNTSIALVLKKGSPSAEGNRATPSDNGFSFQTYGPFSVSRTQCFHNSHGPCGPGSPWYIEMTNPIDEEHFDAQSIRVDPTFPGHRSVARGDSITISGASKARTTYSVTLPATLTDTFGQTLEKDSIQTFVTGDAQPTLQGPRHLTVLDPSASKPTFDVHSVNIKQLSVQVYKVTPKDWRAYVGREYRNPRKKVSPPGRKVVDTKIRVDGPLDEMVETRIDIAAALSNKGKGHAIVFVEPVDWPNKYKTKIQSWVQSTQIGLDAFADYGEILVWATDLKTGRALKGVDVAAIAHPKLKTDSEGLARIPRPNDNNVEIVAELNGDTAFLPDVRSGWGSPSDQLQWFIFDDRKMYKPSETVSIKAWLRVRDNHEGGDIGGLNKLPKNVSYRVMDSRNNEIAKGKTDINQNGGFNVDFKLPKTPNLGHASIQFSTSASLGGTSTYHQFQIQEFRRPEYEVTTKTSEGPFQIGKSADVTATAAYYAGGGLIGADIHWNVNATPTSFTPPNQGDYTFGFWTPWWHWDGRSQNRTTYESYQSTTDSSGKHTLNIDFLSVKPARPMSVVAEAKVTDVNRQQWASQSTMLVHPSDVYVGLKRERYFVEKGKPIKIDAFVVDQEGKAAPGLKAQVQASLMSWEYKNGSYQEVEINKQHCDLTSSSTPHECEFKTPEGGTYQIIATVFDTKNRPNQTKLQMWVTGGKQKPNRKVEQELVTIVPDKEEYKDGDVAELFVQSPFFPAEGILTLRRSGIIEKRRFTLEDTSSTTLRIPIKDAYVPNLIAQVDIVGSAVRMSDKGDELPKSPRRPAFASGNINLKIPPTKRTLNVSAKPLATKLNPGGKTSINVKVMDSDNRPVQGAEVALVVVDEAVLGLTGFQTPDPLAFFYALRGASASDYHQRQYIQLAKLNEPEDIVKGNGPDPRHEKQEYKDDSSFGADADMAMEAPMAAAPMALGKSEMRRAKSKKSAPAKKPKAQQQSTGAAIAVRKNFDALALFAPAVNTNSKGEATVEVKLPDNLTRYRVMAIAVAGSNQFGSGESSVTARMPLMIRPSAPRFLNFGDSFQFPIVIQNQTDKTMNVKIAMRATNAALRDGSGRQVKVPANDRVEVTLPAKTKKPGRARFQIAAVSGTYADAAEVDLPVWTPATTEAFATYGEIDGSKVMRQAVKAPSDAIPLFGGLEVTTSSTQLQALTDAFVYLVQYPYECAEQTSSRVLAISALRDVLDAFKADGLPSSDTIQEILARDVKRLSMLQNHDGGFAWWIRGHESWPFVSIYASHALARAKTEGADVPERMINMSKNYLGQIESHIPGYYSERTKRMLKSYALFVRKLHGDKDVAKAKALANSAPLKDFSLESLGWLLMTMTGDDGTNALRTKIHRYLANKITETAGNAHWTTSYTDGAHLILHSARRTDGVLLQALIEDAPKSDLIAKVVRGLLAHRVRGRWGNTQENTQVLLAMDSYFNAFEKITPNFVVDMWLGKGYAGQTKYKGRSTDRNHLDIPMSYLGSDKQDFVVDKKGKGRLYYRIGMKYAPTSLKQKAADYGFAVQRRYEAIDDPNDVKHNKDGTWTIKSGSKVRVNLTMVAEARRYHVALVDPIPAGLEPMNPALKVTGSIPNDPNVQKSNPWWHWRHTWYEHQNMRDERVEAFSSLLSAGVHTYSYVARATTPGTFVVPPTKAEEMYSPETFGRSSSEVVIVE